MEKERSMKDGRKGGKKKFIIFSVLLVFIIAMLIGIIIYLLLPKEEPKRNVVVTPENVDEVIERMEEERTPAGFYEVSMNTEWLFQDGDSVSSNAFVENSTTNTNVVYFTIALDGEDEDIYQSPYMELGSQLTDIKLDKKLAKGDYNAVITYHLVDDDFNDLSQVSMSMKIRVEN